MQYAFPFLLISKTIGAILCSVYNSTVVVLIQSINQSCLPLLHNARWQAFLGVSKRSHYGRLAAIAGRTDNTLCCCRFYLSSCFFAA